MRVRAQVDNGKLTQFVGLQDEAAEQAHLTAHPGARLVPADCLGSPHTHYYDAASDSIQERSAMALRVVGTNLENVPVGAVLKIDGTEYPPVMDGVAELSFNRPGIYRVVVTADTYRREIIDIEAP